MDLRNVHANTAILSFSKNRFEEWASVVWDLRRSWHYGQSSIIYRCMVGEFWLDGNKYEITEDMVNG